MVSSLHEEAGVGSEENKAIIQQIFDLENAGDIEGMAAHYIPDVVVHPTSPSGLTGVEGVKRFIVMVRAAFPDHRRDIDDLLSESDKVVARWTATGTHTGDFMGIPPTDVSMRFTGITIFRLESGKVVEGWTVWDRFSLMQQLQPT